MQRHLTPAGNIAPLAPGPMMSSTTASDFVPPPPPTDVLDPKPLLHYYPPSNAIFSCARCSAHLALKDELVSKSFSGRDGPAYLLRSTTNTVTGKKEEKMLLTGLHSIADLRCKGCNISLGWVYIKAYEASQRYKEGKVILEKAKVIKENGWTLDT
ncbi:uncharacterized protein L969DRAFT_402115 [Mixia osmundae IAM 14324]|uniref:Protein yippee-like n=1 Tax=Mixia osmundae (strain CBS 9802 / IAM 14324 / JCM 22182 / KY 12970) TaxID=764103 RepID=G7EA03_MIXOS|nr:uncharacterized protein L969DRAFT_402115 [Mixia osmundae IAM 14324]KEI40106.1 hypothetical protein L969DRAFT_402115 [Mixia osmundae IAM 14324]GAA99472.1 hypothetical protein E5Q_06171 [Mixia osmundae IAM 14324]